MAFFIIFLGVFNMKKYLEIVVVAAVGMAILNRVPFTKTLING